MERRGIILTGMTRVDIVPVTDQRLAEAEVTSLRSLVEWGGSRAHGVLFHVTGFITSEVCHCILIKYHIIKLYYSH